MSKHPTSEFQTSVGTPMIRVAAGTFRMGSPESEIGHRVWEQQHEVSFPNDFYVGQTPVTQAQYEAVTGTNPIVHQQLPDAPVDSVNWDMANEYCQALTSLDHKAGVLPDDWEYRLPTEAEWEYACRAGSPESRHGQPQDVAWYHENSGYEPHVVGQKAANAWGFHDMLGNVWEWCQDWFWVANPSRSVRGGSYFNSDRFCRAAQRCGWMPLNRGRYCGFRLVAAEISQRPTEADYTLSVDSSHFEPESPRPPSIYDAINTDDFDLALRVITEDPSAIECVDAIPPPLHTCIYANKPEMLEWLLDHGANIEQPDQDYSSPPLTAAIVMRRKRMIRALVERGADSTQAMDHAQRGLAGAFEDDPSLDREGYREIVELLQLLGIE